jgi:serine/threonine protein kinase
MHSCLQCGCELPADAPKDLCPKCLMGAALGFAPIAYGGAAISGLDMPAETPERIGSYKILQKLGEGGCGIVYLAEQEEPIRRRVALKLIKLGMDTKQVIARFEAERQALALMNHPNVAKVLNAGASETGRPYFVMELVRGSKITEYCDKYCLSTRERLELFLQVCRAIEHAHQKGIIHRDIKPSNILVTQQDGKAVPMVIDFGIAKATGGQALTNKTLFTTFEQVIGTPAYMSPEQAERKWDVDTRTDIYSLGVVLYELLTGKTPFDSNELLNGGWDLIRRKICETEPQTPSTRLTTLAPLELNRIAKCRRVEVPKLIHGVRGDLDWIVMKCLEKEPSRRYETCNAIANDIIRHLGREPVMARPVSNAYRLRKLVSRNRLLVGAVAGVMTALLMGLGTSTWFYVNEKKARMEAQDAKKKAEESERASLERERQAREKEEKARVVEERAERQRRFFDQRQIRREEPPWNRPRITSPTNVKAATNALRSQLPPQLPGEPAELSRPSSSPDPLYIPPNTANLFRPPVGSTNSVVVSPEIEKDVYKGLAGQWWRWLMEYPWTDELEGVDHPTFESPRFNVNHRQRGDVWFFASPFGHVVREVNIPSGVYLFFGMINVECSTLEEGLFYGETSEHRAAAAEDLANHIVDVSVQINGVELENPQSFRVANPDVEFVAPTPWVFGQHGGEGVSSGDGYYLMLHPLRPGLHTVSYRGAFLFTVEIDGFDDYAAIETTYILNVLE